MTLHTVVTCMGRLSHLQATLPAFPKPCVVVDYSCPDRSGDWSEGQPGVTVVRVPGQAYFHKTLALNAGIADALAKGAEYLCFLDADTLVDPRFLPEVLPRLKPGHCLIAPSGSDQLVGVLVAHREDIARSGGFDESYKGWGVEDLDMRLRLRVLAGCSFERLPDGLLSSIKHTDALRTSNYQVKNHWMSRAVNAMILERNIRLWTGKGPADLDDVAKDLMKV